MRNIKTDIRVIKRSAPKIDLSKGMKNQKNTSKKGDDIKNICININRMHIQYAICDIIVNVYFVKLNCKLPLFMRIKILL